MFDTAPKNTRICRARIAALVGAVGLLAAWCPVAARADGIAVIAPFSGPYEAVGIQVRKAVELAAPGAAISFHDDGCDPEMAKVAARSASDEGADVIIGPVCTETAFAVSALTQGAVSAVIALDVRTRPGPDEAEAMQNLLRLAPSPDAEATAISEILTARWRQLPFAILDDGTIPSRELAEALRSSAEQSGLKPVLVDTFRPQLENQVSLVARLQNAGARAVFVAGERSDVAIIARDAIARNSGIEIAGGEALYSADSDQPLPDGVLMVGLAEFGQAGDTAKSVAAAMRDELLAPSRHFWLAYAATQVAGTIMDSGTEGRSAVFDTVAGDIRFDADGVWNGDRYILQVWRGDRFIPVGDPK